MNTQGEETLAAVVERAQTRCTCGRFGVRTSGFCSAECAATAPTTVSTPTASARITTPSAPVARAMPATSEAAEESAFLERMRRLDAGETPTGTAQDDDPETEAFLRRMKSYDSVVAS